jgi:hypothetical protein
VRLFDHLAGTPFFLGNPTVIAGVGVTHLRYPVRKRKEASIEECSDRWIDGDVLVRLCNERDAHRSRA